MNEKACGACRHFHFWHNQFGVGQCRCIPPVAHGSGGGGAAYPLVLADSSACGEFARRESEPVSPKQEAPAAQDAPSDVVYADAETAHAIPWAVVEREEPDGVEVVTLSELRLRAIEERLADLGERVALLQPLRVPGVNCPNPEYDPVDVAFKVRDIELRDIKGTIAIDTTAAEAALTRLLDLTATVNAECDALAERLDGLLTDEAVAKLAAGAPTRSWEEAQEARRQQDEARKARVSESCPTCPVADRPACVDAIERARAEGMQKAIEDYCRPELSTFAVRWLYDCKAYGYAPMKHDERRKLAAEVLKALGWPKIGGGQ